MYTLFDHLKATDFPELEFSRVQSVLDQYQMTEHRNPDGVIDSYVVTLKDPKTFIGYVAAHSSTPMPGMNKYHSFWIPTAAMENIAVNSDEIDRLYIKINAAEIDRLYTKINNAVQGTMEKAQAEPTVYSKCAVNPEYLLSMYITHGADTTFWVTQSKQHGGALCFSFGRREPNQLCLVSLFKKRPEMWRIEIFNNYKLVLRLTTIAPPKSPGGLEENLLKFFSGPDAFMDNTDSLPIEGNN